MTQDSLKEGGKKKAYEVRRIIPKTEMPPRPNLPPLPPESSSPGLSYPYFFNDERTYRLPSCRIGSLESLE